MKKENEKYLEKHNHKIWFDEKANQWMTYIDEPSVKRGGRFEKMKGKGVP